jgi:hypothetical protein
MLLVLKAYIRQTPKKHDMAVVHLLLEVIIDPLAVGHNDCLLINSD